MQAGPMYSSNLSVVVCLSSIFHEIKRCTHVALLALLHLLLCVAHDIMTDYCDAPPLTKGMAYKLWLPVGPSQPTRLLPCLQTCTSFLCVYVLHSSFRYRPARCGCQWRHHSQHTVLHHRPYEDARGDRSLERRTRHWMQ